MERIIGELIQSLPENLHMRLENVYLRPLFNLKPKVKVRPDHGTLFQQVVEWPNPN